ncbi:MULTISPECIES: acyl-CoA thioester hydrolase/BAAT C-terminal domain-containing protein [unclassified Streptomyces]|uniref:acyl-CoA thioester hydrolase/BAAT C-terminal domain-containing protein n=1 Tax=unclassified Streptomyces TaxID=2593676 RepID=UPI00380D735F
MEITVDTFTAPWEGVLAAPVGGSTVGVLVLAGSSGRIETGRCQLLARAGMTALSIRWFGGAGQPAGICEVPLETFTEAIDFLQAKGAKRIGVLGSSKGAEAALLLAVRDPRVDAVVAVSPTSVVWANLGPGVDGESRPYRSAWTWRGEPVPFVAYDDDWTPAEADGEPVAYRPLYERSRQTFAEDARQAAIPIERSTAEVLLVAGGDDEMWPSLAFAQELASRGAATGRAAQLISTPDAGHRPRLPGEGPPAPSGRFRYGGTAEADAVLGAKAWPDIVAVLTGRNGPATARP